MAITLQGKKQNSVKAFNRCTPVIDGNGLILCAEWNVVCTFVPVQVYFQLKKRVVVILYAIQVFSHVQELDISERSVLKLALCCVVVPVCKD